MIKFVCDKCKRESRKMLPYYVGIYRVRGIKSENVLGLQLCADCASELLCLKENEYEPETN